MITDILGKAYSTTPDAVVYEGSRSFLPFASVVCDECTMTLTERLSVSIIYQCVLRKIERTHLQQ